MADARAHLLIAKAKAGTQTGERRGRAHCKIAAFYATAVKSHTTLGYKICTSFCFCMEY